MTVRRTIVLFLSPVNLKETIPKYHMKLISKLSDPIYNQVYIVVGIRNGKMHTQIDN